MHRFALGAAAAALLLGSGRAEAAFVEVTVVQDYTDILGPTGVRFVFGSGIQFKKGESSFLFDLALTPGDEGGTFATDTTTYTFAGTALGLTDGIDDPLRLTVTTDGKPLGAIPAFPKVTEGTFFNNPGWDPRAKDSPAPPDLAGYTVTGVTLTVNQLDITPGQIYIDSAGSEYQLSNVSFRGTLSFEVEPVTATPAPSGLLLGGVGGGVSLLGGLWRRRRMA